MFSYEQDISVSRLFPGWRVRANSIATWKGGKGNLAKFALME
jgi:hypothetical protein